MKRLFLLIIFYFGLIPYIKDSTLEFSGPSKSHAQGMDYILKAYLESIHGPNDDYTVNVMNHSCNCAVYVVDHTTDYKYVIFADQFAVASQGFTDYLANPGNYNNLPPPVDDGYSSIYTENYISHLEDILEFEQRMEDFSEWSREFWAAMGNGVEAGPEPPPACDGGLSSWGGKLLENVVPDNNIALSVPLPCVNSFLLPSQRIIHFTAAQQARIAKYHFDGSTLIAIEDHSGVLYTNAQEAEVSQYSYKCEPDWLMQYGKEYISKVYSTYKFIAFSRLRIALTNGSVPGLWHSQAPEYWDGIPENNLDYCIAVSNADVEMAAAGKVVMGATSNGTLYCETLTETDVLLATFKKRNERFKLSSLHLDHYANLPKWVQDFLHKMQLYPDQCTIDYVNQHLDQLHQSAAYLNEPGENVKKLMEVGSVGYSMLFGTLYCKTNEASAAGKSPSTQFGLGLLNEAIASIDVRQIVDGLAHIAKGLGNQVDNRVMNIITTVEEVVEQLTIQGYVDYELLAKKIVEANNTQLSDVYVQAVSIANHFKQTYFTNCNADPNHGDICAYRQGQVTMMVLPIVLTGGEWAVIKANALAGKYAAKSTRAIELINDAYNSAKQVLQESYTLLDELGTPSTASKTIIKEANGAVSTTIKQEGSIGNEVLVITEAADFFNGSKLNTLTLETPTANGYLAKAKFEGSATHKFDAHVDPNLKAAADDIIANGDIGGEKTELLVQNYLFENKMNLTRLDGKYGSNNGYDGIFIEGTISNPTKIYITECKQQWNAGVALAPANPNSGLAVQMSDQWIQQVAVKLGLEGKTAVADMIRDSPWLIEKYVVTVNKSTASINVLKLGSY